MTSDKIISILGRKFPIGTYASHPRYPYCRVISIDEDGLHCIIKLAKQSPRGYIFKTCEVNLADLEEIDIRLCDHTTGGLLEIPME